VTGVIAVLGSANMDVVTEVERIPRPGETVAGRRIRYYAGGKGANQAVAAARLGCEVAFFGKVGRDSFGEELMASLRADGVDVSSVAVEPDLPTGTASIWVEESGENAIACVAGANGAVDDDYVLRIFDRLVEADVLLLQFEIPLSTIGRLLSRLPVDRPMVIVDPAPAADLSDLPLDRIDILTPNRSELRALTGLADLEPAVRQLAERGVRNVVCKAGEEGAYWMVDRLVHVPAIRVDAVDSTASGDAFNAALGCALIERGMIDAIRWANIAGALTATQRGAQPSLPRRDDVDRRYSEEAG
jgi:ribokinase